jgi:hypothetical protein
MILVDAKPWLIGLLTLLYDDPAWTYSDLFHWTCSIQFSVWSVIEVLREQRLSNDQNLALPRHSYRLLWLLMKRVNSHWPRSQWVTPLIKRRGRKRKPNPNPALLHHSLWHGANCFSQKPACHADTA